MDSTPGIGAPVFALSNPGGRGLRVTFGFVTVLSGVSEVLGVAESPEASNTSLRCCRAHRAAR